jgi:adenine phosphoribosyltransferase
MGGDDDVRAQLVARIRDVPDFPIAGVVFKDITPLLQDPHTFRLALEALAAPYRGASLDLIVGMESRGFVFGAPIAYMLNLGFVPIRKLGKLPWETNKVEYALEYGSNTLEIHRDAIKPGQRVLIVDDLLATGGTVRASIDLVEGLGGVVVAVAFLVELTFLGGRDTLAGREVCSVIQF